MSAFLMLILVGASMIVTLPLTLAGEYTALCGGTTCPSVSWVDSPAGQPTSFTLMSSVQSKVSNYVAFAFANATTMASAQVVVDCYDVNGVATMGTSRNSASYTNQPSPQDAPKVFNRNATRNQGMLTCTFDMALPNSTAFIIISEGQMNVIASPAIKTYHNGRYQSSDSYSFNAAAATSTAGASAGATLGATVSSTSAIFLTSTSTHATKIGNITTSSVSNNVTMERLDSLLADSTAPSIANLTVSDLPAHASMSPVFTTSTSADVNSKTNSDAISTPSARGSRSLAKNAASSPGIPMNMVLFAYAAGFWLSLHH